MSGLCWGHDRAMLGSMTGLYWGRRLCWGQNADVIDGESCTQCISAMFMLDSLHTDETVACFNQQKFVQSEPQHADHEQGGLM